MKKEKQHQPKPFRLPRPKGLTILNSQKHKKIINIKQYRNSIIQLYIQGLLQHPNGTTYTTTDIQQLTGLSNKGLIRRLAMASGFDTTNMGQDSLNKTFRALAFGLLKGSLDDRVRHTTLSNNLIQTADHQKYQNSRINENAIKALAGNLASTDQLMAVLKLITGKDGTGILIQNNILNHNEASTEQNFLTTDSAVRLLEARGTSNLGTDDHTRLAIENNISDTPEVKARPEDRQAIASTLIPVFTEDSKDRHDARRAEDLDLDLEAE